MAGCVHGIDGWCVDCHYEREEVVAGAVPFEGFAKALGIYEDRLAAVEAERDKLLSLVDRLAVEEPTYRGGGTLCEWLECTFCGSMNHDGYDEPVVHDESCAWVAARAILAKSKKERP